MVQECRGFTLSYIVFITAQSEPSSRVKGKAIQSNFNGSNTFGTMKISSRQG